MNKIPKIFDESWYPIVKNLYQEPLLSLKNTINDTPICPEKRDIFNVFSMPVDKVRVVILGQDPYPKRGDAIGYSFATTTRNNLPASLRIMKKEIEDEGFSSDLLHLPEWKTLSHWRRQGIFLLNTALTVQIGKAGSHLKDWNNFTVDTIRYLSNQKPCVWLLMGAKAQAFTKYISNSIYVNDYNQDNLQDIPIDSKLNYIVKTPHPAAEAYAGGKAGFYGSNCFSTINQILNLHQNPVINW